MIYEAICLKCGQKRDYSRLINDRDKTPVCCNEPMKRVLSPTRGKVDVPAVRR